MIKPETTVLPLSILTVTSIVACVGYINFDTSTVENVYDSEMYNGINITSIQTLKQMDLRHEKCKSWSNSPTVKCVHCVSVIITVYNEPADVLAATIQSLVSVHVYLLRLYVNVI